VRKCMCEPTILHTFNKSSARLEGHEHWQFTSALLKSIAYAQALHVVRTLIG
jgi:hypothetical protein